MIGYDRAPFKITHPQSGARLVNLQADQLVERHFDQPGGVTARLDEMSEQRRLATLESLQQEGPPQLVQIAVRLSPERFLEVQSTREPSIDLVRIHVLAEHNADVRHPRQFLDGVAHVVGHQEREIRRTPICRQAKFDVDAIVGVHIGPGDELERSDRLVQLRVGHCFQPPPDLGFAVGA